MRPITFSNASLLDEAYQRQKLRMRSTSINHRDAAGKDQQDAFYQAITLRIFAQGFDYTVAQSGRVVAGSKTNVRRWSEYWTFIRNAKPNLSPRAPI